MTPTIRSALQVAAGQIADLPFGHPRLEAELLLAHVLACPRSTLVAWPERTLTPTQWQQFERLVAQRSAGTPLAYLLGEREFWSLRLRVDSNTLIPRPETEVLVERALCRMPAARSGVAADLGTGSGAVAIALASERPRWLITATDESPAALQIARDNAQRLQCTNVRFEAGDWCDALGSERFDVIASNPPYIPENDPHLASGDVRFEPLRALVSGEDGLDAIRILCRCAQQHLHPGGWLLFEHGPEQGPQCRALLAASGYENVNTYADLEGRERVTEGSLPRGVTHDMNA